MCCAIIQLLSYISIYESMFYKFMLLVSQKIKSHIFIGIWRGLNKLEIKLLKELVRFQEKIIHVFVSIYFICKNCSQNLQQQRQWHTPTIPALRTLKLQYQEFSVQNSKKNSYIQICILIQSFLGLLCYIFMSRMYLPLFLQKGSL